ncbi:hypothetical protein [Clostridium felsineum]|uniref:Uncharacterized protein n=1 Tax=Clostridium felsineum TaxID=36839 RepID=A0A1S8MEV1_9CLOT|nr:hypothetical protein [Clostridium felsineum]URZ07461.1 hypothetical protein CLROS_027990 [Clostridium felsineum]URZ12492.1 hypothetical protein CROST_032140 [Clostridium felsineum]URZ17154.1 hypothetical protein CLFE_032060 [Clostridium felsineum DSM 794]
MRKIILLAVILVMSFELAACKRENYPKFKITKMTITGDYDVIVKGNMEEGTIRKNDLVTIEHNNSDVEIVRVKGIININTRKVVQSISKGEKANIRLEDIGGSDVSVGDMLVNKN